MGEQIGGWSILDDHYLHIRLLAMLGVVEASGFGTVKFDIGVISQGRL